MDRIPLMHHVWMHHIRSQGQERERELFFLTRQSSHQHHPGLLQRCTECVRLCQRVSQHLVLVWSESCRSCITDRSLQNHIDCSDWTRYVHPYRTLLNNPCRLIYPCPGLIFSFLLLRPRSCSLYLGWLAGWRWLAGVSERKKIECVTGYSLLNILTRQIADNSSGYPSYLFISALL